MNAPRQVRRRRELTAAGHASNILRLMSANVPEQLDAWRMVAARRRFDGHIPLAQMERLRSSLVDTDADEVVYSLEFGRDEVLGVAYAELSVEAGLPLLCQRSMKRFVLPVKLVQRLGLIREEAEESALPPDYEPLLVPADAILRPQDMVEDELVLAVPVVPVSPDSEAVELEWAPTEEELGKVNPFAALAALKK